MGLWWGAVGLLRLAPHFFCVYGKSGALEGNRPVSSANARFWRAPLVDFFEVVGHLRKWGCGGAMRFTWIAAQSATKQAMTALFQ